MSKTYTIQKTRGRTGSVTLYTGTVADLTREFSYTLQCGNSKNAKINRTPSTILSLVSNLNKSITETQRGSFYPDDYKLISK